MQNFFFTGFFIHLHPTQASGQENPVSCVAMQLFLLFLQGNLHHPREDHRSFFEVMRDPDESQETTIFTQIPGNVYMPITRFYRQTYFLFR